MLKKPMLALLVVLSSSVLAQAQQIPIRTDWTKAVQNGTYTQWINHAPPAYLWQNEPGTIQIFGQISPSNAATNFCVPATIGTALLNQKLFTKKSTRLKLAGVEESKKSIHTVQLMKDLVIQCKSDVKIGTSNDDAFACLSAIYKASGYADFEIKLISNNNYGFVIPGYTLERRKPTLKDILQAFQEGYEVIGIAVRIDNRDGIWKKVGSHWFNIMGFGNKGSGLELYAIDSTARYNKQDEFNTIDGSKALFTTLTAQEMTSDASIVPEIFAPIRIKGLRLDELGPNVVLGSLLLLKTN